jgi:hypothetical protein
MRWLGITTSAFGSGLVKHIRVRVNEVFKSARFTAPTIDSIKQSAAV